MDAARMAGPWRSMRPVAGLQGGARGWKGQVAGQRWMPGGALMQWARDDVPTRHATCLHSLLGVARSELGRPISQRVSSAAGTAVCREKGYACSAFASLRQAQPSLQREIAG